MDWDSNPAHTRCFSLKSIFAYQKQSCQQKGFYFQNTKVIIHGVMFWMKYMVEYLFCSPKLLTNIDEIKEIESCIDTVQWADEFRITSNGRSYEHQSAYNKAFDIEFSKYGWSLQPLLYDNPKLIGDFAKNDIFVEVQFGNSATLYRDYYKFHYGLTHSLLSLAVLIVPTKPTKFFPTRRDGVNNMAEFVIWLKNTLSCCLYLCPYC